MADFKAIDVEAANADRSSICQIGIVSVQQGEISNQWQTLVDPEDWFDPWNVMIHGIDEEKVAGSPTFAFVADALREKLNRSVLISHTSFDKSRSIELWNA